MSRCPKGSLSCHLINYLGCFFVWCWPGFAALNAANIIIKRLHQLCDWAGYLLFQIILLGRRLFIYRVTFNSALSDFFLFCKFIDGLLTMAGLSDRAAAFQCIILPLRPWQKEVLKQGTAGSWFPWRPYPCLRYAAGSGCYHSPVTGLLQTAFSAWLGAPWRRT